MGVALSGVSLGTALPVDPGEHLIVTQVPGGPERVHKLVIAAGEQKRVDLEIAAREAKGADRPAPSAVPVPGPTAPVAARPGPLVEEREHTWAWIAGGLGAAGLALGTVTGVMSMGKKQTVDDNCHGTVCSAEGKSAADSGKTLGTISTISLGAGVAGLATGVVLWLAAPQGKTRETGGRRWAPMIAGAPGAGALAGVEGAW